jgi:hypothetical protein
MAKEPKLLIMVCSDCGSTDVFRDAGAVWNVEKQDWELGTVYDQGFCNNCAETGDSMHSIDEVEAVWDPDEEEWRPIGYDDDEETA